MTSSVRAKMMEVEKQKKVDQRIEEAKPEMVRARDEKGHYIADDPKTPENEAWVEKAVGAVKKSVAKKKPAAKKKTTKKV